jgi:hydroxyethylthiazole kinase-like uncharacterized protein yjeF
MPDDLPPAVSRPIYRVAGIREIEARFLPDADPPLMERAGAAAAEVAAGLVAGRSGRVLIAAGPGNNGGDGFVVGRLLRQSGREVTAVFAADPAKLPADAAAAYQAYLQAGGTIAAAPPDEPPEPVLAIDGLFGIGLQRPLQGLYAEWVGWLNRRHCPVLAIDIPSGLDADTGRVLGCAVRATHTATFIALKPGLLTLDGPDHCGQISVHALGLDPGAAAAPEGATVRPALFESLLRPRPLNSHKGMAGDAGIVGGAPGMVGAALLAGRAALKLGAGRVFVGLLAGDALQVDPVYPELMLRDPRQVVEIATALAVGPGLGQSGQARDLLDAAIARPVPLVLDADALNLVAAHPVLARRLARRGSPALLTPHPAEAARLLGTTTAEVQQDRITAARTLAGRLRAHVVLKGCGSVVAAAEARWFVNTSGNPGMASAGMGDVLTGFAAALLARHPDPLVALLAAVHLHGAAGDALVGEGIGPIGLAAGELVDPARRVLNRWITDSRPRPRD